MYGCNEINLELNGLQIIFILNLVFFNPICESSFDGLFHVKNKRKQRKYTNLII